MSYYKTVNGRRVLRKGYKHTPQGVVHVASGKVVQAKGKKGVYGLGKPSSSRKTATETNITAGAKRAGVMAGGFLVGTILAKGISYGAEKLLKPEEGEKFDVKKIVAPIVNAGAGIGVAIVGVTKNNDFLTAMGAGHVVEGAVSGVKVFTKKDITNVVADVAEGGLKGLGQPDRIPATELFRQLPETTASTEEYSVGQFLGTETVKADPFA